MEFFSSTIGKKMVMAVTGVILFGFVVGHMIGNLQIYQGAEKLNHYAAFLKSMPALLWGTRITLLVSTMLHVGAAISLTLASLSARPETYVRSLESIETNYAARTMRWSGVIVLFFAVYHLLHFTFGLAGPDGYSETDVYGNVVRGFSVWWISAWYILAMMFLGFHLYHGLWSGFQTMGLNHPKFNCLRRMFAGVFAAGVMIGNISIPVSVLLGIIK